MAGLPQQVQRELEEAERIRKEMEQATPPAEPAPPAEPPEPPPAEPAPTPPEPAPAPVPAEPARDAAYWEHRFKTLEGISRAEKARTDETLRQMNVQLEALRQQQKAPPAQPEQPLVTTQDEATFGADLVDMARRAAKDEGRDLSKRLEKIESFIGTLVPQLKKIEQVEGKVDSTREERFWSELSTAVPDWEKVNTDPNWHKWLEEYDPIAGRTRQEGLNEAQAKLDYRRVAGLFKLFKASQPAAPAPQANKSKAELARQVAPTRSSTVTVQSPAERTFTGQEYAYWLDPRRAHDTDAAALVQMRAEVDRAMAEGRVQW